MSRGGGSDAKYFQTTKKGEIHELKEELNAQNKEKKKEAVKKVIAAMTVGKDVSMLFADVVNCMQTPNIELKKLVYLYLINYAKSQPDLAILAVNTFVKDAENTANPLIRALAVRTMGCIRVDKITEYLCEPLRKCLKDEDPYVRKTAAICVAKLYDINAELVEDRGFLDLLKEMLSDSNPMVVANAVAALSEVSASSESEVFEITPSTLNKLLAAMNESTEWGQVFILDALSSYEPQDAREAESIVERVTPRLAHANSAVVLSAVKVMLRFMELIHNQDTIKALCKKMAPSLVTLLSTEPEIQYVALRNIDLIVQKRSNILSHEIKVFFCKYNDPIYVKMEKLEIMIKLASERNIEQVLQEFKEYAQEVDIDFVRKSVRAIGRCAIKLERATERCINVLLELIQTKVNYVVQEAVIVIKDIFRRYPNRYESIIGTLCENLDTLDEPEAKASMIWIVGEYAERIDNADELLNGFLEAFHDEPTQVQLQLLTATVKLFLKRPSDTQSMVHQVLSYATQDTENPDLRDRGYVYWRLLSTDPEAAKAVVLAEKPVISDDTYQLDPTLLDTLVGHISSLASIYHKPPEVFVSKARAAVYKAKPIIRKKAAPEEEEEEEEEEENDMGEIRVSKATVSAAVASLLDLDLDDTPPASSSAAAATATAAAAAAAAAPVAPVSAQDFFNAPATKEVVKEVLVDASKGEGMEMSGGFTRRDGQLFLDLHIENKTAEVPLAGFAIQFNRNSFGLIPAAPLVVPGPLMPHQSADVALPISTNGPTAGPPPTTMIEIAIKNNLTVAYTKTQCALHNLLVEDGELERSTFLSQWRSIPESNEHFKTITDIPFDNIELIKRKLVANNFFVIAQRKNEEGDVMYMSVKTSNNIVILVEITYGAESYEAKLCTKTAIPAAVPLFEECAEHLLRHP